MAGLIHALKGVSLRATFVKMRRLEATLGSFGPADMFAVGRHLWVRWGIEDGEVRLDCRYYKERPGKVEEPWKLIVAAMKEFIDGLRLKGDPMSHVGWPAENRMDWYYIPYLLGVAECPDT